MTVHNLDEAPARIVGYAGSHTTHTSLATSGALLRQLRADTDDIERLHHRRRSIVHHPGRYTE